MKQNDGEYFDGAAVTVYDAKFAGTFDLAEEDGVSMRFQDVVTLLVTAEVGKSEVTATRTGDLKRSNRLDIIAIRHIDSKAAQLIEQAIVNGSTNPQGSLI